MASPVLLVADDLALIAAVKRVLAREGYEVILATSAADAVIAWGHALPGLVLLQPTVESERGLVALEELQSHPDSQLLRVVLLGDTLPGADWPVEPLPIDAEHLAHTIERNLRSADSSGQWSMREIGKSEPEPEPVVTPTEPAPDDEGWRATPPAEQPDHPHIDGLEEKLFGDLARDVEAEAMQSVESSLPAAPQEDDELKRLEEDVLAEAQRRRQSRERAAVKVKPEFVAPPEPVLATEPTGDAAEASFGELSDTPSAPPSRAEYVLARAEQMVLEIRAQAEAAQRAEEADLRRRAQEDESLQRRADHAEEAAQVERTERLKTEEQVLALRDAWEAERQSLENALTELQSERALRQQEALDAQQELEAAQAVAAQLEQQVRTLTEGRDASLHVERELEAARAELASRAAVSAGELEALREQLAAAQQVLDEARLARDTATQQAQVELEAVRSQLLTTQVHLDEARQARDAAQAEMLSAEEARDRLQAQLHEVQSQLERAQADVNSASELHEELARERDGLRARVARLEPTEAHAQQLAAELDNERARAETALAELATQRERLSNFEAIETLARERGDALELERAQRQALTQERDQTLERLKALDALQALAQEQAAALTRERALRETAETALAEARAALDATSNRAEKSEATAQLATEKLKVLEARETMPLSLPNQQLVGLARHDSVGLEGLARVVCQLVLGNVEAKIELGVTGGVRTLWFKRGQVLAAESSFEGESLITRARRDGLIDGRQEEELRMVRSGTPREQLEALRSRRFIRDVEVVPLVQRHTEQVTLDAFTEPQTQYRIAEEAPGAEVLQATVPRPTLPMLTESLRRAVDPSTLLEQLGGGDAVVVPTDSELDLRALGFSERERKMLSWADGETTVEDLSLASGLKPDVSFRALLVARLLGIVQLAPGRKKTHEPDSGALEVQRLEAKFDQVQDADYFTILGLGRSAGAEEVRRAFQRLSAEFDPLRFSGHPDPALQQRAQAIAELLEEAARALEDDRRRAEYARHLLD